MSTITFGDTVFLLSVAHNKFVTVERNGECDATRRLAGDFEALTIFGGAEGTPVALKDKISLRSAHGKYITVTLAGVPLANRDAGDTQFETFTIIDAKDPNKSGPLTSEQIISLVIHSGKKFAAEPDGTFRASKTKYDYSWDHFRILLSYDPMLQGSRNIANMQILPPPQPVIEPNARSTSVKQVKAPEVTQGFEDDGFFDEPEPKPVQVQRNEPLLERSTPKVQQKVANENLLDLVNGIVDLSLNEKKPEQVQVQAQAQPKTLSEIAKERQIVPQQAPPPYYPNQQLYPHQQPMQYQPYLQQQYQPYPQQQYQQYPQIAPPPYQPYTQQQLPPQITPPQNLKFDDDFSDDAWGMSSNHTSVNPFDDPFANFVVNSPIQGAQTSNQNDFDDFEFDLQPPAPQKTPVTPVTPVTPPSPTQPRQQLFTDSRSTTTSSKTSVSPSRPKEEPKNEFKKAVSMPAKTLQNKNAPVKRKFEFRVGIQPNYLFRVGIFDEKNTLIYKAQMRLEHRTEINDAANKPVALISREALHIHPTFSISTNRGRIGLCKQRFKMTERKFNYQIMSTGQFIKMTGDFGATFVVKKNEKPIGQVLTKQKGYILILETVPSDMFHVICQTLIMTEMRYLSDGVIVIK